MKKIKSFLIVAMGNMLEWYDIQIAVCLYKTISNKFLPGDMNLEIAKIVAVIMIFASYLSQPIGALYFSYIADTKGRVKALSRSINLMAIASLLIGITPTYSDIGIFAPIIFCIARIIQGISLGAESKQCHIYVLESYCKHNNQLLITSFITVCSALAFIASQNIGDYINAIIEKNHETNVWRIPFLIGSTIGFLGIKMRSNLLETLEIKQERKLESEFSNVAKNFLKVVFEFMRNNKMVVILYSISWWALLVVVNLYDTFERIIANEILNFDTKGYYAMYILMIFYPLLFLFKPKSSEHTIELIYKRKITALVFMVLVYFLLCKINVYSFYVGLFFTLIVYGMLGANLYLITFYLIPKYVRCSIVSFFASCISAFAHFTTIPLAMKLKLDYGIWEYIFIYPICLIFIAILTIQRFRVKNKNIHTIFAMQTK